MFAIDPCELPPDALLASYFHGGAYVDCYVTKLAAQVSHAQYVQAFYTTPLFKTERLMLDLFLSLPSTDLQARQLAEGKLDSFAAWTVEGRTPNQLLLCDFRGRTRSWLMTADGGEYDGAGSTSLYFGSAVVPVADSKSGKSTLGLAFNSLLGFHKLYSRLLLHAARSRLTS